MGHDTPDITDAGDSQPTKERIEYVIGLPGRTVRDTRAVADRPEIRGGSQVFRDLRLTERPRRPRNLMSAPASAACRRCGAFASMLPIAFGCPMHEPFRPLSAARSSSGTTLVSGDDASHRSGRTNR
jgi:hypothetical protein